MAWAFRTVPDELLAAATAAADHFDGHGYTVTCEKQHLGYPNTPTLHCYRKPTRIVVEVADRIDRARLAQWAAYGRSNGQDFRVAVCVPADAALTSGDDAFLRDNGVGCLVVEGGVVAERVPMTDLALAVALPELRKLKKRVRELLGPAYEQFGRGQWREGFEAACQAFESEARRYLKRHSKRIKVLTKKGPVQLTPRQIDGMPMGALARTFASITAQNHSDKVIGQALAAVNKDRIGAVHHRQRLRVEARLRRNVGRHMWMLVGVFTEVVK